MVKDLLAPNLRLVVCGVAVGTRSAEGNAYYADPRNRFWHVLFEIGLTPRRLIPAEYHQLLGNRIGLTDIVQDQAGNDSSVQVHRRQIDALRLRILTYHPRFVCFNGKRAALVFLSRGIVGYGVQPE